ncbi:MAG: thiamine diphosphokinase [Desulfobacteraceae bacterium]|nr:thiamine diphosphokinase [Desulfobacteraceae bacterium]
MESIIIASGTLKRHDYFSRLIRRADLVVCADGGARHLERMNLVPHVAIGDLDSIDTKSRRFLEKHHVPIIRHPKDKDATDTELAVQWAMEKGATELTLLGVTGTRMDHTLANILLLKSIGATGTKCRIIDDNNEIHLVTESLELEGSPGDHVSLIPLTETVKGVTIKGVDFPLDNAEIPMGSSLGISNRFSGTSAQISIKNGLLAVTKSVD